jgi:membrane-associated phospholipid phosphatase
VWIPLAAAGVFQIDGWDRKVSNWARRNVPVFGSRQAAENWTQNLVLASTATYFATVVTTSAPTETGPWLRDKAQGLAVGLGAIATTAVITSVLKNTAARTRPNGSDNLSFPSGDTSHSAVLTGLARDNVEDINIDPRARRAIDVGLDALTIGTAWSRIEAGAHFPSDTLFSIALGNFVSHFLDAAFFTGGSQAGTAMTLTPVRGGFELSAQLQW